MNSRIQLFLILFTGIITFVLNYYGSDPVTNLLGVVIPALTLITLTVTQLKASELNKDHDQLSHSAEEVYITGYAFTLIAILAVALKIGLQSEGLIQAASIKIITAIVGLLCMVWLKKTAFDWERAKTGVQELYEVEINQRVKAFEGTIARIKNTSDQLNESMDSSTLDRFIELSNETANQFEKLHDVSKRLSESYGRSIESYVSQLNEATEASKRSLSQETDLRQSLINVNERFANLGSNIDSIGGNLKEAVKNSQEFTEMIADFRTATGVGLKETKSLSLSSKNVVEVLSTLADTLRQTLSTVDQSNEMIFKNKSKYEQLLGENRETNDKLLSVLDDISEKLNNSEKRPGFLNALRNWKS